jgi:adenine phosphoribosyltransferase
VGIESRGFIFAAVLADRLKVGLTIVRKLGELPYKGVSEQYDLEYDTDSVVLYEDAINPEERTVVVDDLIATGGTL